MVDMVVQRKELRSSIGRVLSLIMKPGFDAGTMSGGNRGKVTAISSARKSDTRSSPSAIRSVAKLSTSKGKPVTKPVRPTPIPQSRRRQRLNKKGFAHVRFRCGSFQ